MKKLMMMAMMALAAGDYQLMRQCLKEKGGQ